MYLHNVETRARRLFESRFLPKAESPDAERRIDDQLAAKVAKLDTGAENQSKLRRVVSEASQLWADRSNLRKKDLVYLAAALLYFISPLDAVPDLLPGVGYVDDVIVVSAIVGMIVKGLSSLGTQGKERLEDWIDERTEVVFQRFDESASTGVEKSVAAVAIGLWGTTTAAAVSLSVAAALGGYSAEWLTYLLLSTALVVACNLATAAFYWREYRKLSGPWQERLRRLAVAKLKLPHFIAIGLPIVVLIGLGISRALFFVN